MPQIPYEIAQPHPVSGQVPLVPSGGAALGHLGQEISRSAEIGAWIYDADQRAKASAAVSSASSELQRFTLGLDNEPNYDSHEQQFQQKRDEILGRYRKTIQNPRFQQLFDQDAGQIADRFAFDVAKSVETKRIDSAQANSIVAANNFADQAALDPSLLETNRSQAFALFDAGEKTGVFHAQDVVKLKQQWDERVSTATLRGLMRQDPKLGEMLLRSPTGPYMGRLTEPQRQEWISEMQQAQEQQVRQARADRIAARQEAEWNNREVARRAVKDFIDASAPGGAGVTLDALQKYRNALSDEEYATWHAVALNGGHVAMKAAEQPGTYVALWDMANSGMPGTAEAIDQSAAAGFITAAQHDTLRKNLDDSKFRDIRRQLEGQFPTNPINIAAAISSGRPVDPTISAQARYEWDDWQRKYGEQATVEDARKKWEKIKHDYTAAKVNKITGQVLTVPSFAVSSPRTLEDVQKITDATRAAFDKKYPELTGDALIQRIQSDPDFIVQATLIAQWRAILEEKAANEATNP